MTRLLQFAAFAACAVFLLAGARPDAVHAAEDDLADKARMLMDYQAFLRGDRDGTVRFAISASKDFQSTPLAELAVRLALLYDPATLGNVTLGEAEARRILNNEAELSQGYRDILRSYVARAFTAAGRREDAMLIHSRRGLAMSWLAAGPFSGREGAGFETRQLPEGGAVFAGDVIEALPDAEQFRQWRKSPPWQRIPDNRSFPYIRPWRNGGRDDDGSMLMFTCVTMKDADNTSAFHVYAETSWRLYIDGNLLAEVDHSSREAPMEHVVPYSLGPGNHTVMLQLFPPPRGVDRNNVRVALRLHSEAAFAWDCDAASPEPVKSLTSRREPQPLKYMSDLREKAEGSPVLMGVYAFALFEQEMYDQACWWAERAANGDANAPFLLYLAGLTTSQNPLLPLERRRDLAAAWHRKALALKPDLVPSLLFMAEFESLAGKPREAGEYVAKAHAVNAGSLDVLLARAEWARLFASGATERVAWDECGAAFPHSPAVQLAIASVPQDGFLDMDRRLEASRAAVKAGPYLSETSLRLAAALADAGNMEEAESVLRDALELFKGDVRVLSRISEIYTRLDKYDEAIAILSNAIRITPEDASLWRWLGDCHMNAGRQELAMRYWGVSLAAKPGQFELADMMRYLSGTPGRLFREDGYDAIAMTAAANPDDYAGDVIRLLDRSVLTFVDDGSHRRLTHDIDLARTRIGGESLTDISEDGEILAARIVFPNSNTLEPEPYPGRKGLRLPVIMQGAARELRVLTSADGGPDAAPIAPWFFQDPSGRMPLLVSEFEVRAPKGMPLATSVNNLGNVVEYRRSEEDGKDVHRWSAKLSLPSYEPDAVDISERVPSVEVGITRTWDDVVFHELRRLEGKLVPSMRMRATLANLYQDTPGQRPDPLQAARAIYRYVLDNIDPMPRDTAASHVHLERMGDRRLLLLAMLRAAGLDAHPAAARPSVQLLHPPSWELPRREIFTIPMIRLAIPGGDAYWLDTRFDSLPFGKITDDLSGAMIMSFLPTGPLFETLPPLPAEDSMALKERTLRLPEKPAPVEISGRSLRRGIAGLMRDQELTDADVETRKKILLESVYPIFPDAVLKQFDVQRTDDSEASSLERYEIASSSILEVRPDGTLAVSLSLFPPNIIAEETRNLARRQTACHIKEVHVAEDRNTFRLPTKGSFTRIPRAAHIPSRFGLYQLRVFPRGETSLEVIRQYQIPAQRLMPWDWSEFLAFLERIDMAEKQWIEYSVRE